ncbi:MAG: hypothetical protein EDM75_15390 [Chlorobiota bacterium]|nr:MAG: hypothetical protein EDM75_15390 [Chlorobiota bacterium]
MSELNFLPGTIVTGLISHPVGHSFSPSIHNSAARVLGLNMVYLAFNVKPDSLEDALTGMRALGIKGFNLSLPHKKKVIPFLDHGEACCGYRSRRCSRCRDILLDSGIQDQEDFHY